LIYFLRLSTCKNEYSLKNNQLITSIDHAGFPETNKHTHTHTYIYIYNENDKFKNYSGVSEIILNRSRVV